MKKEKNKAQQANDASSNNESNLSIIQQFFLYLDTGQYLLIFTQKLLQFHVLKKQVTNHPTIRFMNEYIKWY